MKLIQQYIWTYVKDLTIEERLALKDILSRQPSGYQYMRAYKNGTWDGYINLFKRGKFPAGLTDFVVEELKAKNISGTLQRPKYPTTKTDAPKVFGGFTLRDYQVEAVQAAIEHKSGILKMATNAGKTLVFAVILSMIGQSAIVVVPTRALLAQTAKYLTNTLKEEIGMFGGGRAYHQRITVTTMASLKKCTDQHPNLSNVATVIIDETHHGKAKTIQDIITKIPAPFRFGVSGTPLSYNDLDDMALIGVTGSIIYEIKNIDLIEEGWSTKPIIRFAEIDEPNLNRAVYYTAYAEGVVLNEQRNSIIAEIADMELERGQCLILVDQIRHAHRIGEYLPDATIATAKSADVSEIIEQMKSGEIDCLIATPILAEGVDIPSITSLILAAGGKSNIRLLQRVGRSLRKTEGVDVVHIYDFIDNTNDILFSHSLQRYETYEDEGFEVEMLEL